jgi:hypothetical protein
MFSAGTVASETGTGRGGTERLRWDCATIGAVLERESPSALERLVSEVGPELAAILQQQPRHVVLPDESTA